MSVKTNSSTMNLMNAKMIANGILMMLKPLCEKIEIAGSIRRGRLKVNDIDIVLIPKPECMDKIKNICTSLHPGTDDILSSKGHEYALKWGSRMATFNYKEQVQVDLYFADEKRYPIVLMIRTGSKEHNVWLCTAAKKQGMYLAADGSGLYADRDKRQSIHVETEGDIYGALRLPYFEPADRDGEFNEYPQGR